MRSTRSTWGWRIGAVVLTGGVLLASACHKAAMPSDDTVHLQPTTDDSAQSTAAAQSRIAGAFYDVVVPKLKSCWGRVQGKGEVAFWFMYRTDGHNWVWQKQELAGSSLEKGQEAVAMQCMQESARGSAFPVEQVEQQEAARSEKELVIHWGWPVPLPEDTTELARMISIDVPQCPKVCQDCVPNNEGVSVCVASCKGFKGCVQDGTGSGCRMTRPECLSGWSGQWVGTFIAMDNAGMICPQMLGQKVSSVTPTN